MPGGKPNILIMWGDDVGQSNLSIFTKGMMGYRTPNIDSIGEQGMLFTDYYAEQSCTAGRASFITGQCGLRTGLTKVGMPGADVGLQAEDPTIATVLKSLGYATGQFGKNHLGDRDEHLPDFHRVAAAHHHSRQHYRHADPLRAAGAANPACKVGQSRLLRPHSLYGAAFRAYRRRGDAVF